jgi:two-component system response regulator
MNARPPAEILLVEDNPHDLELALRALGRISGAPTVRVARDGAEALAWVFGGAGAEATPVRRPPDAILLDIKLPAPDGIEVLRQIKSAAATRALPVVMLSSSRETADLAACYSLGANSYVVKPVDAGEYERAVAAVCDYWINRNLAPSRTCPWNTSR